VLLLDEPVNGLDPEGIRWLRGLLRSLAAEGRAVLVSSHLISEMALTAEHVVIIGKGRLLADLPVGEVLASTTRASVTVRSPDARRLETALAGPGVVITRSGPDLLVVTGLTAAQIGDHALAERVAVHELTPRHASLEEAFMDLTNDAVEFHGGTPAAPSETLGVSA